MIGCCDKSVIAKFKYEFLTLFFISFSDWLSAVYDLSHTLIVFNSAINFLIYVAL